MAITDWPEDERPRERLLKQGAASLSDAELLAIFLRVGVTGKSAVDLARDMVRHFGDLDRLFKASQPAFCEIPGLGPAKYAQLQAVLEMAKRAMTYDLRETDALNSPEAVKRYLRITLGKQQQEIFSVLFLDTQNRPVATEDMFHGTLTQTSVYPREVVKRCLYHNAASVILAHNHPSGTTEPSHADQILTQSLKNALSLIDVRVLDHFIVGGDSVLSFAERGLL
ncbi:MAG: DNA repair protein RadC [Sulfuricellaceae bacterium]|nr:DNA repair protein RadC [Sulfuricellaceae bacterium]